MFALYSSKVYQFSTLHFNTLVVYQFNRVLVAHFTLLNCSITLSNNFEFLGGATKSVAISAMGQAKKKN